MTSALAALPPLQHRSAKEHQGYSHAFERQRDGGSDTAIADFEQSMRFSPRDPFSYTSMIGMAFGHYNAGRYAEAANWADKAIRAFPPYFIPGLQIAIMIYVGAGRIEDAQRVMADCLRMMPHWGVVPLCEKTMVYVLLNFE